MANEIVTLENLQEFKNKMDETYIHSFTDFGDIGTIIDDTTNITTTPYTYKVYISGIPTNIEPKRLYCWMRIRVDGFASTSTTSTNGYLRIKTFIDSKCSQDLLLGSYADTTAKQEFHSSGVVCDLLKDDGGYYINVYRQQSLVTFTRLLIQLYKCVVA